MPSIRPESSRLPAILQPLARVPRKPPHLTPPLGRLFSAEEQADPLVLFWAGWFRRLHRGKHYATQALRRADAAATDPVLDGSKPQVRRFVWELAKFTRAGVLEWQLLVWGIDDISLSFQTFPTLRDAKQAYRSAPQRGQDAVDETGAAQARS
jgi:hypothetical protein